MKTSELTGAALDWAVAKCEGYLDIDMAVIRNGEVSVHYFPSWNPSTDWLQGGPIIEREGIMVGPNPFGEGFIANIRDHDDYGPTPLIAAMRCYVASKLGDEVEVPPELMTQQVEK
jgi:hypothetical protein